MTAQKKPKDLPSGIIHFLSGDTLVFKEVEKTDYYISGFKQNKVTKKWVIKSYPAEDILFLEKESEKLFFSVSTNIPHLFCSKSRQGVLFDSTIGLPHANASAITIPKLSNSDAKVK